LVGDAGSVVGASGRGCRARSDTNPDPNPGPRRAGEGGHALLAGLHSPRMTPGRASGVSEGQGLGSWWAYAWLAGWVLAIAAPEDPSTAERRLTTASAGLQPLPAEMVRRQRSVLYIRHHSRVAPLAGARLPVRRSISSEFLFNFKVMAGAANHDGNVRTADCDLPPAAWAKLTNDAGRQAMPASRCQWAIAEISDCRTTVTRAGRDIGVNQSALGLGLGLGLADVTTV
jgi:hypothetical protein